VLRRNRNLPPAQVRNVCELLRQGALLEEFPTVLHRPLLWKDGKLLWRPLLWPGVDVL
jgi:hypothetical protein